MQALDDVVVLDLTHHIAGPYATQADGRFRRERDQGGTAGRRHRAAARPVPGRSPHPEKSGLFFYLNCNKRSVVLDLKHRGRPRRPSAPWPRRADIVVENFAPGVIERLGIGHDFFRAIKPSAAAGLDLELRPDRPVPRLQGQRAGALRLRRRDVLDGPDRSASREDGRHGGAVRIGRGGRRGDDGRAVRVSRATASASTSTSRIAETHFGGVDRRHATAIAYQFSGRKIAARGRARARACRRASIPAPTATSTSPTPGSARTAWPTCSPRRVARRPTLQRPDAAHGPVRHRGVERALPRLVPRTHEARGLGRGAARQGALRAALHHGGPVQRRALPRPRILGEGRTPGDGRGRDPGPAVHDGAGRLAAAPARAARSASTPARCCARPVCDVATAGRSREAGGGTMNPQTARRHPRHRPLRGLGRTVCDDAAGRPRRRDRSSPRTRSSSSR